MLYIDNRSAKLKTIEELVDEFRNCTRQAVHARIAKFKAKGDLKTVEKLKKAYEIFKNEGYGENSTKKYGKVYGMGVVGEGDFSSASHPYLYNLWRGILERCSGISSRKDLESYKEVGVSDYFKNFQNFASWAILQKGYNSDFDLDKDLLSKDCKIYSEDTCVFIPHALNIVIANCGKKEKISGLPTGVRILKSGSIQARCRMDGRLVHLGTFCNIDDAAIAYKIAKKKEIVRLADVWKDEIDTRAYDALIAFET